MQVVLRLLRLLLLLLLLLLAQPIKPSACKCTRYGRDNHSEESPPSLCKTRERGCGSPPCSKRGDPRRVGDSCRRRAAGVLHAHPRKHRPQKLPLGRRRVVAPFDPAQHREHRGRVNAESRPTRREARPPPSVSLTRQHFFFDFFFLSKKKRRESYSSAKYCTVPGTRV